MSQELYKLLPFLKPVSGSADTTAEQKTQALQRKSAEQIRQGGGLTGQTKTKELYKLFPFQKYRLLQANHKVVRVEILLA